MNGLKQLNDVNGHDSGDRALRAYFEAVVTALRSFGDAYRLGGDEVLAIMPNCTSTEGLRIVENACRLRMASTIEGVLLSIAAGVLSISTSGERAEEVRSEADQLQNRAKTISRNQSPRPSVICANGVEDCRILAHTAGAS